MMRRPELVPTGDQYDDGTTGSVCGDYSLGAEPSNRAVWQVGPDRFVTVTETYFVTGRRDSDAWDLDPNDVDDALAAVAAWDETPEDDRTGDAPEPVRFSVDGQTEWILCTDPDDPGGTEITSDYEYDAGSVLYYETVESAEREARRLARAFDPADYSPEYWAPVAAILSGVAS